MFLRSSMQKSHAAPIRPGSQGRSSTTISDDGENKTPLGSADSKMNSNVAEKRKIWEANRSDCESRSTRPKKEMVGSRTVKLSRGASTSSSNMDLCTLLNTKIEATKQEKGKVIAEQQAYILRLKEALVDLNQQAARNNLHCRHHQDSVQAQQADSCAFRCSILDGLHQILTEIEQASDLVKVDATETCFQSGERTSLTSEDGTVPCIPSASVEESVILVCEAPQHPQEEPGNNDTLSQCADLRMCGRGAPEELMSSKEAEISELRREISRMQVVMEGDAAWHDKQLKELKESKAREVGYLNNQILDLQDSLVALQDQLEAEQSRANALEVALEEAGRKEEKISSLNARIADLEERVQRARDAEGEKETKQSEAMLSCGRLEAEKKGLLEELEKRAEEERAHREEEEARKFRFEEENKRLEAERDDARLAAKKLTAEVEELRSKVEELNEDMIDFVDERKRTLSMLNAEKEKEVVASSELKAQLSKLEQNLANLEESNRNLSMQKAVMESQLSACREDVERNIKERDDAKQEVAKFVFEKEMMGSRLLEVQERSDRVEADLKRELEGTKTSLFQLQVSSSSQAQRLQSAEAALELRLRDLQAAQAQLDKAQQAKTEAMEKFAVLEAEYRTYKSVSQNPSELADQLKGLLEMERQKALAQSKIASAQEDALERRKQVSELQEQVLTLQQKLTTAENQRKRLHNELQELKGNIRVFARIRPGDQNASALEVEEENSQVTVQGGGGSHTFKVDKVFAPSSSQEQVFSEVSAFVQSALDGYNVSLFAYGQTGAGKTFTMFGREEEEGIIPRSLAQILQDAQAKRGDGWEVELSASFLEIYQENIRDLLDEGEGKQHKIVQGARGRMEVTELIEVPVGSRADLDRIIRTAEQHKTMARTEMNERSSRSHTVFILRISSSSSSRKQTLHGTLNLIDLAGSERLDRTQAAGVQLKEAQAINKSLSALSDVFLALSKKLAHVPYRNSKLTFLLQPCLSGDGKALVVTNVSPDPASWHESVCTLRFASIVSSCELGKATRHVCKTQAESVGEDEPALQTPSKKSSDIARTGSSTPQQERDTSRPSSASRLRPPSASRLRPPSASTPRKR